jgi:DNA repair protein RadC
VHLRQQTKEQCVCYYLRENTVVEKNVFTSQNKSLLVLKPRKLFNSLITSAANQLLLIHNHPSNSCYPSHADIRSTEILAELGSLFEYQLLDHIIVTKDEYFSFEEAGLISSYHSELKPARNHFA